MRSCFLVSVHYISENRERRHFWPHKHFINLYTHIMCVCNLHTLSLCLSQPSATLRNVKHLSRPFYFSNVHRLHSECVIRNYTSVTSSGSFQGVSLTGTLRCLLLLMPQLRIVRSDGACVCFSSSKRCCHSCSSGWFCHVTEMFCVHWEQTVHWKMGSDRVWGSGLVSELISISALTSDFTYFFVSIFTLYFNFALSSNSSPLISFSEHALLL